MTSPDLTVALVALSEATQRACAEAKRARNEELFYKLRQLGWTVAGLLAEQGREQAKEQLS